MIQNGQSGSLGAGFASMGSHATSAGNRDEYAYRNRTENTHSNDNIGGGSGDDAIQGGEGDDVIRGGAGNDSIEGDPSDIAIPDVVRPAATDRAGIQIDMHRDGVKVADGVNLRRAHVATLATYNDVISGGTGDDRILGKRGHDQLFGNAGDDAISGESGNDWIEGDERLDRRG